MDCLWSGIIYRRYIRVVDFVLSYGLLMEWDYIQEVHYGCGLHVELRTSYGVELYRGGTLGLWTAC